MVAVLLANNTDSGQESARGVVKMQSRLCWHLPALEFAPELHPDRPAKLVGAPERLAWRPSVLSSPPPAVPDVPATDSAFSLPLVPCLHRLLPFVLRMPPLAFVGDEPTFSWLPLPLPQSSLAACVSALPVSLDLPVNAFPTAEFFFPNFYAS